MEEYEAKEKLGRKILSSIIALVIIGAAIIYVYKYVLIDENNNQNKELTSVEVDKIGKEKFDIINSKHRLSDNGLIFFTNNTISNKTISNEDILYVSYTMMSLEDKNKSGEVKEECFLDNNKYNQDNYPITCSKETFDKDILGEQVNNLFGNINVNYSDFRPSASQKCFLKGDTYNCYLDRSSMSVLKYFTVSNYAYTTYEEGKLYIYSYLLTFRKNDTSDYEAGIYSDSNATNKIDDLNYYLNELHDNLNSETSTKLIEKYRNSITMYKSTFEKYNNNYVWVSTEIEK